jgi:lipopolysaccharide transport system permease protein
MSKATVTIDASSARVRYWQDLWAYKDLLYFLSWRDILVRYKQTVIGVGWAVLRPLLTMLIFTFVFGKVAALPSYGIPYSLLVFSAMLPWYFFSNTFSECASSLVSNGNMISKIYFPRLIIPLSTVAVCAIDLAISFVVMLGLMLWLNVLPAMEIVFLPIFVLLAAVAALGPGLWCAALNVKYRDFRYIVPFITQLGLYISPVGFVSSVVPEKWQLLFYLNPMAAVIDLFRWSLLGEKFVPYLPGLGISFIVMVLLLVTGIRYFRKTENTFADLI